MKSTCLIFVVSFLVSVMTQAAKPLNILFFTSDDISRKPSRMAEETRKFLRMAKAQGKPFFHNVNCYDPHRPFIGIKGSR